MSHGAIAKIVLGVMLGFAALTALSLLWMPLRVLRRGAYGRRSSAMLRSVYPFVLGLGGWFLGALIAISTMPDVSLDDELLALLSVGAPVGLGIYWAWVNGDRRAGSNLVGFAAAAAGALTGAWLGFHATAGLVALLTAIAGAVAGANLALIFFDISQARSVRRVASRAERAVALPTEA
jgi:hypothetical protein